MIDFDTHIDRWQAHFESRGCIFDNIQFRNGSQGVSVHVADPERPYRISLPKSALLVSRRIEFNNQRYLLDESGMDGESVAVWREMLDFVLSDERIDRLVSLAASFYQLPETVRTKLNALGLLNYVEAPVLSRARAMQMLTRSRYFFWGGEYYQLPLLEFVNHDAMSPGFITDTEAISVSGQSRDEVTIRYSTGDTFHFLSAYGFVANVLSAFSFPLNLDHGGQKIQVARSFLLHSPKTPGKNLPIVERTADGAISVSYILLGNLAAPDKAYENFRMGWQEAGLTDADGVLRRVYRTNVRWLTQLLRDLDGVTGPAADMLRQATYQHLDILSDH